MENKFYKCETCGNIIQKIHDSGVSVVCCGQPMKELFPNTNDAAFEKHVPVVTVEGNKVHVVGSVEHPMIETHWITWIGIETKKGWQKVDLMASDKPEADFILAEDDVLLAAYEYCNLHGLWKKAI